MKRPMTVGTAHIKGNREFVLRLRKACSEALRNGCAAFTAEDEDGDDASTTIVCSEKIRVKGSKEPIGFKAPLKKKEGA